jgi:lysyl-tRNA synthetase class 2
MSLEEIRAVRVKKLRKIKEIFGDAFPAQSKCDFSLSEVVINFAKLSRRRKPLVLAGRIMTVRSHGGVIFCDFKDGSFDLKSQKTVSLQAYLKRDLIGDKNFALFSDLVDAGDYLEFTGTVFKTKKGEKSIKVSAFRVLAKSLRPLPDKWHGFSDTEERFRKRYLDLLMNDGVRSVFELRSKIISETRNFLDKHGFMEMETPILQPLAGGALAEPFKTHHNALDLDLFLRIAPELYLKRLLIGNFGKVYELGRNFRNEGIDATHNPEFTMLEFYQAYCDTNFMRDLVESLIKNLVKKIFNKQTIDYENHQISFSKKFAVVNFFDVLKRHALVNDPINASLEDFQLKARQFGVEVLDSDSKEKIMDNIFKKVCRSKLIQPTFVTDYPLVLSPLAKRKGTSQEVVDRFQLIMGGLELVNAFSELNDPLEQAQRFRAQQELRRAGDKEASELDQSYLEALEYAMPPAVGVGIGIDRLVMFLLNVHNIKEVILFPTMRPKGQ